MKLSHIRNIWIGGCSIAICLAVAEDHNFSITESTIVFTLGICGGLYMVKKIRPIIRKGDKYINKKFGGDKQTHKNNLTVIK